MYTNNSSINDLPLHLICHHCSELLSIVLLSLSLSIIINNPYCLVPYSLLDYLCLVLMIFCSVNHQLLIMLMLLCALLFKRWGTCVGLRMCSLNLQQGQVVNPRCDFLLPIIII